MFFEPFDESVFEVGSVNLELHDLKATSQLVNVLPKGKWIRWHCLTIWIFKGEDIFVDFNAFEVDMHLGKGVDSAWWLNIVKVGNLVWLRLINDG